MVNDDAERLLELGDTCSGWASGYKIGAELREIAARLQDRDKARFSASEEKITRDLMAERDSLSARVKELEGNLYEAETQAAREAFNLRAERDTLRRENEQIAARVKELELEVSAAADECTEYEMQLAESQAAALNAALAESQAELLECQKALMRRDAEIERLKGIEVLALFLNSTPGVLDDSDREWAREQIAARAVVKGPGA